MKNKIFYIATTLAFIGITWYMKPFSFLKLWDLKRRSVEWTDNFNVLLSQPLSDQEIDIIYEDMITTEGIPETAIQTKNMALICQKYGIYTMWVLPNGNLSQPQTYIAYRADGTQYINGTGITVTVPTAADQPSY